LTDQREIWKRDEESHGDIGHVTKTAIFANSRWRTAAILKLALSSHISCEYPISIIFGTQMQISIPRMDFWHKIEILQIQYGDKTWKSIHKFDLGVCPRKKMQHN